ncbi:MAG TPA: metallophosphoesterase [Gemmatimonadales bacterium]|nr:metallophosphoesterase [Gemmatimonadales bacterium]
MSAAPVQGRTAATAAAVEGVTIVHLSDVHFGVHCDLLQIEAIEEHLPRLGARAVVVSGDLSQRARHGELQRARVFVRQMERLAPTLVIPGNHDVQWWASPLHLRGTRPLYRKYRQYFGEDLTPVLRVPGAVIAGALTSYGIAPGSLTWNLRDLAVKGHLPKSETDRVSGIFQQAAPGDARVLVMHHNVLPGKISRRMGLAHWRSAQRRIEATGADVVLCGHDHQEGAGELGITAISSSGTHSSRMRGGRPSVFNLVRVDARAVHIQHFRWEASGRRFLPADAYSFARRPAVGRGAATPAVSVAGGDDPQL